MTVAWNVATGLGLSGTSSRLCPPRPWGYQALVGPQGWFSLTPDQILDYRHLKKDATSAKMHGKICCQVTYISASSRLHMRRGCLTAPRVPTHHLFPPDGRMGEWGGNCSLFCCLCWAMQCRATFAVKLGLSVLHRLLRTFTAHEDNPCCTTCHPKHVHTQLENGTIFTANNTHQ